MIIFSIILSIVYWVISAVINSFILGKGDFIEELFFPEPYILLVRLLAIFFIIGGTLYLKFLSSRRKNQELELDREHGLIPSALNKIGSLMVVVDSLGRIVRFNHACEQITGYDFEEVKGKYFWRLFLTNEEAQIVKSHLMKLDKKEFPKEFESSWLAKDGKRRLIKWSNTTIFDKKSSGQYVASIGVDITSHKQAQEVLKRSEREYKNIIDNIGIGITIISSDLKSLYANKYIKKWFPDAELNSTSIVHNIFSDFNEEKCSGCPTCLALEDAKVHDAMIKTTVEGKNITYKVTSFPVQEDSEVVAAVETIEDFTQTHKREEEIRHNYLAQAVINSLLRFSLESISLEGFLKCALNIILSTPPFSTMATGAIYLVEDNPQLLKMKVQNKIPDLIKNYYQDIPFNKGLCGKAAAAKTLQFSEREELPKEIKRENLNSAAHYYVPILYMAETLGVLDIYLEQGHKPDKKEREFLTAITNTLAGVIYRKKGEGRLNQINQCFMGLGVDPVKNIQNLVDLAGQVLEANTALYSRLDFKKDTFNAIGIYNAEAGFRGHYKAKGSMCFDAVKNGGPEPFIINDLPHTNYLKSDPDVSKHRLKTYVAQAVRCRGDYVGVICALYKEDVILKEEDKKFLGIIASAIGIEEERIKSSQELKEAYAKLEEAQTGLVQSEKLAALGRFSSGIAHEVKNPLGIILGGIEFLELKLKSSDQVVRTALKKIKESTLRADGIVRNLLKFARPSQVKKEVCEPRDLVEDTLSLLKYRVSLINIDIITDFSKEKLYIEIDKNQMGQVLFNLLMNAIEAMENGGVLRVKTYKKTIEDFNSTKEVCTIDIVDTGEGISKENIEKLFEPFFTTKRDKKGTGLGLSMSKMIVQHHKGSLELESEIGKGTTARIILPLAKPEAT